jgi:hypothetical protein
VKPLTRLLLRGCRHCAVPKRHEYEEKKNSRLLGSHAAI